MKLKPVWSAYCKPQLVIPVEDLRARLKGAAPLLKPQEIKGSLWKHHGSRWHYQRGLYDGWRSFKQELLKELKGVHK